MVKYLLIAGALFVGCVAALYLGGSGIILVLFPLPVAVYLVRGHVNRALGLVVCAAGAALAVTGRLDTALQVGLLASVGLMAGIGISRRWTYGWTLTAMTGMAAVSQLLFSLLNWAELKAFYEGKIDALLQLRLQAADPAQAGTQDLMLENLNWLRAHWTTLSLGAEFWLLLLGACLTLSLILVCLRRFSPGESVRGSFIEMRTTEWLVWAAIAVAGMFFLNWKWPGLVPPVFLWNAALALAAIYWLNGLSALVYALYVLRMHFLLYAVLVFLLLAQGVQPMLCCIGLFDTWADFRRLVDKAAAARKKRLQEIQNGDDEDKRRNDDE